MLHLVDLPVAGKGGEGFRVRGNCYIHIFILICPFILIHPVLARWGAPDNFSHLAGESSSSCRMH
jgi:hypothetical protein